MNTTFLTCGLACIVAGIIGGGLKAWGIEIPALQSGRRQGALILFGLLLMAATFIPVIGRVLQPATKPAEQADDKRTVQVPKDASPATSPKTASDLEAQKPDAKTMQASPQAAAAESVPHQGSNSIPEEKSASVPEQTPEPVTFKSFIEAERIDDTKVEVFKPTYISSRITIRIPDAQFGQTSVMAGNNFTERPIELSPGTHTISFHLRMKFITNTPDLEGDCSTELVADKARRYKWELEITPNEGIKNCYITSDTVD